MKFFNYLKEAINSKDKRALMSVIDKPPTEYIKIMMSGNYEVGVRPLKGKEVVQYVYDKNKYELTKFLVDTIDPKKDLDFEYENDGGKTYFTVKRV